MSLFLNRILKAHVLQMGWLQSPKLTWEAEWSQMTHAADMSKDEGVEQVRGEGVRQLDGTN